MLLFIAMVDDSSKAASHIRRQLNVMKDPDVVKRKDAVVSVQELLQSFKVDMSSQAMEELLLEYSKMLIQSFADPSEKIRELSVEIYSEMIAR